MAKFIDIHSHIAWGIDDGMPSIEDAQSALESAKADGFVGICSTPHFIPGQLDVSIYNEIVSRQMELKEMSPIPIYCGGEVMMNSEFIDGLDLDLYPTLNGSRYMLVEYNVLRDIHSIDYRDDCLYELKVKGFVPVIAHIERYFHSGLDYSIIDNWIDMGCVLQINRTSILGMHGKTIQSNALSLLDDGYCDVIGTDTHRASGHRISKLSDAYSVVSKRIGSENADILFFENPKRILSDMDILNIEVVKKKRNQFDVDEIYRGLRTNIEFSQMDEAMQVITCVSTVPNEGKSTIACNLARIMAAKYKNVLLIDCDLRNASVHKTLHISNRSGLTNIISEFQEGLSINSYEGVQQVQYDGGQTLTVITAGHRVPNPSEVLGSKRMGRFLEQARKEFGYIIIDSPPMAIASDTIPLSNVSDGVLYVVDAKSSDKRKVKTAINDLKRNGGHVIGVVLNKVDMSDESHYGYGYGYGYGGDDDGKKK